MANHAPTTSTHNTPTVTDPKSATTRWWTWHHTFLAGALLADVIYIVLIVAGIGWSGRDRVLPPQISQILVGILGCTTVSAVGCLIAQKLSDKVDRGQQRADTQFTILAAQNAELKTALEAHREAEEKTVPLAGAAQRVVGVYTSSTVAAVRVGHDDEAIAARVEDRVVQRIEGRIDEARKQGEWSGYVKCAKDGLAGVGGEVRTLPSARNGRPAP